MGRDCGGLCSVYDLFQGDRLLAALGLCGRKAHIALQKHTEGEWDYDRLSDKESRLDLCLASLALLFLLFYFAIMGIPGNMNYAVEHRQPLIEII